MKVKIISGTYGWRADKDGSVEPVSKGGACEVPDAEAARLVGLGVASYVESPAEAPNVPPAPPSDSKEPPNQSKDTTSNDLPENAPAGGEEDDSTDAEIARLERMLKDDLEQMAQDLGVDISEAKNKHDIAVLIAAAESDEAYDPSEPEDEDIVR